MSEDRTVSGLTEFRIEFAELDIGPPQVAAAMGYPDAEVPGPYDEMIGSALAEAGAHAEVRAGFRLFPPGALILEERAFRLAGVRFDARAIVARSLRGSTGLAIFAVTAVARLFIGLPPKLSLVWCIYLFAFPVISLFYGVDKMCGLILNGNLTLTGAATTPGAMTVVLGDGESYLDADFGWAGALPRTGADLGTFTVAGLIMLLVGAALVLAGRREPTV